MAIDREKLAAHVVDGWDMDDLVHYATSNLEGYYKTLSDEELEDEAVIVCYEEAL